MNRPGFADGIRQGIPIFIGYMPIAVAFGLLAKGTGISLGHTMGLSLFVFAGASQFMALELIALGTGAMGIVLSTFIVNIRHMLMSMSLHEKTVSEGPVKKAAYAFFITDEVFAVASTRGETIGSSYLFGLGIMAYSSWNVNTALGFIVGSFLPTALQEGMGIALYAMFIGLLVPSVKKNRRALILAGSAALFNILFLRFLPPGWAIIAAAAAAIILMEFALSLFPRSEEGAKKEGRSK
jgi:4-azaleucine resistance transporter AzlC